MATLAQSSSAYTNTTNWLTIYKNFTAKAEFNRIGWAATAVALQGCILAPALLFSIFYSGGGDWQVLVGNLSFMMVMVPILSALPVKYIFSTFGISLTIHLVIILINSL